MGMKENQGHEHFMAMAIEEARFGMQRHQGGPFGAVIVLDGQVLARAHNQVTSSHDPTAHAEVCAIRKACQHLGTPHLKGALIYSNFEPCPMCLSAIYWARLSGLYYSSDRSEAEEIGFMDRELYSELALPPEKRALAVKRIRSGQMDGLKRDWMLLEGRKLY